jgi:hypothetical protein
MYEEGVREDSQVGMWSKQDYLARDVTVALKDDFWWLCSRQQAADCI